MTLNTFYKIYDQEISKQIREALKEDSASEDITSRILSENNLLLKKKITARLFCKERCILAGIKILKKVMLEINKSTSFKQFFADGTKVPANAVVMTVHGPAFDLLRGERTALNFVQRMSGIATLTARFADALKNKNAKILHTRKTTPNFRLFEIASVKTGGGDFHRASLNSGILIKDNHIKSAGSVEKILKTLREKKISLAVKNRGTSHGEVEVKTESELNDVIKFGKGIVETVMLDNFPESGIADGVRLLKKEGFKVELSGGINESNFDALQHDEIDFYSIGMLTHSYKSINFSLEF